MSLLPLGLLSQGGGAGAVDAFEQIQTINGTGASGTITFSSIPSTYKHLQIRYVMTNTANNFAILRMQVNGDTGSNYSYYDLYGNNSSVQVSSNTSTTFMNLTSGAIGLTTTPNAGVIDVLDYTNTSKFKTVRTLSGTHQAADYYAEVGLGAGNWRSTSAVTSLTLFAAAGSFATAGRISLYGIKG